MKRLIKFGSVGLVIASIFGMIAPLTANAFDVYKDSDGKVYANGVTPSVATEFVFSGVSQTKSYVANTCGAISMKGTASSPLPSTVVIAGNNYNISAFDVALKPTCTAGTWNVAPSGSFRTTSGEVVIIGLTAGAAIPVTFTGATVKKSNANACGFAKIGGTTFTPSGEFAVTGQTGTFDFATIALKPNADICKGTVRYVAQ